MSKTVARLFRQFQPAHYDLSLVIDRGAMRFSGTVTLHGRKAGRPSRRLTFHQKGLKIVSATLTRHDKQGDRQFAVTRINNQNSLNEVRLHAGEQLFPGEYTVTMAFEGVITRPMNGIYPCFFTHDEQDKTLIATQFESHHAREAFPCIDEPEAKATFDLTLITAAGETCLGNTPIKVQKEFASKDGGQTATAAKAGSSTPLYQATTFETTPRMSVYLLAFVTGQLAYKEITNQNGVLIRSYATPANVKLTEYSLDVAARCLEFFDDYFGLPYPLKKLDLVALPDFSAGAMENWGLITFRETALLADPRHSSIESKQMVALVICHELTHQWFGNLVTMKWWDDLWLNESFANMMEYRAVHELYPEWHIWEQFVSNEMVSARRRDSLADVQSVHTDVNHPDEISTLFDPSIVYAKGGSILYMLLNYIGEDVFRAGLQAYFKKHAYSNTQADDLWEALSAASGQDIGSFMHKWLTEPGFPLVTVDWEPGTSEVSFTQHRFLSDPTAKIADTEPWQVPLNTTLPLSKPLLDRKSDEFAVSKSDKTLLFNHDSKSYYLPYYRQAAHLQQIVSALRQHEVDDIDRFLLLDTYNMLQRGGVSQTTELLELVNAYEGETSETVWGSIAMGLGEARKLMEYDEASDQRLDTFVGGLVTEIAGRLGWDDKPDDSAQTLRLRGLVISMAAGAKVQAVIDEGLNRFAVFKKPSDLSPSTRSLVYYCGTRYGTQANFNKLFKLHGTITNADEKEEIAAGLTAVKQPKQYQQLLDLLTTDAIRRQDLMHWFVWLLRNRYARAATWQWLTDNWNWAEKEFSSDKSFDYFPRYAGSIFSTQAELQQFKAFFEAKKSVISLARNITLAEQEITARVAWRARNEAAVKAWLKKL